MRREGSLASDGSDRSLVRPIVAGRARHNAGGVGVIKSVRWHKGNCVVAERA